MTSPAQVGIVSEQVEDAREKGARILTGGRREGRAGDWYEPTVIADVDHSMKVMTEETFGPVIPVMKVGTSTRRSSSPTTPATGSARRCSPATPRRASGSPAGSRPGHCNVNDVLVNYNVLGLPMGGWKNSGIGVRHGAPGIRRFCHTEALTIPRMRQMKTEPFWFPYSPRKRGFLRRVYRFMNARGRASGSR